MKLEFIQHDASHLDDTSKAKIRRHAARGKNLGRKISRPSRIKRQRQPDPEEARLQLSPMIGDSLALLNLPVSVAPGEREITHSAISFIASERYAPGLAKALRPSTPADSPWISLLLTDAATFHCAIATYLECTQSNPQTQAVAIRHTVEAFRLINDRLSADKISLSTMAAVLSLSGNDTTQGRYQQGYVHASGLMRMVYLRGGLAVLMREQPVLFQKLYRTDLDYAMQLGTPLRTDIGIFEASDAMKALELRDGGAWPALGPQLSDIWGDACALSTAVNEVTAGRRQRLLHGDFVRAYVYLGHRLMRYLPLRSSTQLPALRRIVYLGLAAFVSSFLCGLDRRVRENPTLAQLIQEVPCVEESCESLLWLLFLGAIVLQGPAHEAWLIPRVREAMSVCGVRDWPHAKEVLSRYPWIDSFYDDKALSLCCRALSHV